MRSSRPFCASLGWELGTRAPSRAQTVPPYPPPHRFSLPANGKISTLKTGKLCPETHADGAFLFAARRSRTPHPLAGCGAARTPSLPAQAEQRNRSLILIFPACLSRHIV